jgi:hypothetical protein
MTSSRAPPPTNDSSQNRPSMAASSVYSQPSPDPRHEYRSEALTASYYGEVSPPSSPTRSFTYDHGGVSPIEESYGNNSSSRKPSQRQGSQIPVPRKAAPENTPGGAMRKVTPAKAWTKDVGKKPMQWDDYSGEPTFDGEGKPGQVKPGEFNLRAGLRPVARKVSQPPMETEQETKAEIRDKASRFAQKGMPPLSVDTSARPAWKGASGRQALVPAPKDNPGLPAPKPRRSSKQMDEPVKSPVRSPQTFAPQPVAPAFETALVASPSVMQEQDSDSMHDIKPTPPLKTSQDKAKGNVSSPAPSGLERTGYPSPVSPNEQATTPTQATHDYHSSPIAPRSGDIVLPKRASQTQTDKSSQSGRSSGQYQDRDPTSRFSWTTTNTSTTYQHSPPPSPPPPMPTAYANIQSPPSPAGSHVTARVDPSVAPSILNRSHPTRRLGDQAATDPPSPPFSGRSFSITSRKPVPIPSYSDPEPIRQELPLGDWREGSTFRVPKRPQRATSLAPSTTTSMNDKALPKTPGQLSAVDLITSLQAQQNDLQQQRFNIQRVIRDLEKPGMQNPLYTDFRARKAKDKRVEILKLDLAEVINAEHDVGLRLHRAWKRREREDPNTPVSILWVRRATSGV